MSSTLTLTQEAYSALAALARKSIFNADGTINQEKALLLESFLKEIEKENGVTRYGIWIQWQDPDEAVPPTANFPISWPSEMRYYLEIVTRPISRADVEAVVKQRAPNAVSVMVTPDPAALVGWSTLDSYFIQP